MLNNQITKAVNNALNNNIMVEDEKKRANNEALALVLVVLILLLLNFVFGPWLWNNIARKLIPALGEARWYDTVALSVLLSLIGMA
tara:strand:+ start:1362 stop:1619 length:258 start_codon:yes stop_codon:yes gene_type:complete